MTSIRPKVLWLSQNLPFPPKTGVLQRNYNLLREAAKWSDVDLVAILKEDILPNFDSAAAERELKKLCRSVTPVRLPIESSRARFLSVVVKSIFTEAPFTVNWASSPALESAITRAVAQSQPDIVFFDTISLASYRRLVGAAATVLNHHNIESRLFENRINYEPNRLKRMYYGLEASKLRRYERRVAGTFDVNTVVSSLDGERLREICPQASTAVLANGVDTDYFRAASTDPERAHLVMVSGMNWFPNLDAVLFMTREIWPRLVAVNPGVKLTIVGAGPPQEVRDLAKNDPRVVVTGFVDDVRPHMDRAQVYLCPMRDGGGTRLKILDALSMGKPIVATTMALEGIHVEPERDVLVADTPDAFVTQIERVIGNPTLSKALSVNAREFAERNFDWNVIGERMRTIFEGIARGKSA